jgi:hypothetical protein
MGAGRVSDRQIVKSMDYQIVHRQVVKVTGPGGGTVSHAFDRKDGTSARSITTL